MRGIQTPPDLDRYTRRRALIAQLFAKRTLEKGAET
jgi:hypothetical protein